MSKQRPFRGIPPRDSKAQRNGSPPPPPTPIDSAIDASQATPGVRSLVVEIAERPVRLAMTGKLRLDAPTDPNLPMLLVHDAAAGCWKAILLPPGSHWMLQPAQAETPLWLPPGTKR